MADLKQTAAEKAIDLGGTIIIVVVVAAAALAVVGGNLIQFVQALL